MCFVFFTKLFKSFLDDDTFVVLLLFVFCGELSGIPEDIIHQNLLCHHHRQKGGAQVSLPFPNLSSPSPHPNFYLAICTEPAATDLNMHVRGVCEPPKGKVIVSVTAMFTTSSYFTIVMPRRQMYLTARALGTTACSTAPRMGYRVRNPMDGNGEF